MEPPFSELPPLVEALAQALVPLLDKPFALFGCSLGSLIAFELARWLRIHHETRPVRLFVAAAAAPQIPRSGYPIHNLPENEFLAKIRSLNGTPRELLNHKEFLDIVLLSLRADFRLYENYRYSSEVPLTCPISAYGGMNDGNVKHCELEKWRDQTSASFSIRKFPGGHFFLRTAQEMLLRNIYHELR
jgi:medium-chain acyl-[acyl-carrier-protein] hydrolase